MRKKLFIEKIFPVKLLNQQVYYEHGGNPFKGLHRWYSRKPLSFSRASVLASLLPADITTEEFLYIMGIYSQEEIEFWEKSSKTEAEKDKLRNIKEIRLYKQPPTQKQIQRLQHHCQTTWGKDTPSILDAFAGGGSIPFEGVRYNLNVFASDLNPVAYITMKAGMEYPLKFGKDLQQDIDKWVNYVASEAKTRLKDFFPSQPNETVQNYLWAHTVNCPHCHSTIPLSPNWWLSKTSNYAGKGQARKVTSDWYAVKPIPNLAEKRVDFELIKGKKGKGTTININDGQSTIEFDPSDYNTIGRGVGKCCNCDNVIEDDYIKQQAQAEGLGHQLYAVAFKEGKGSLQFRIPTDLDLEGVKKAQEYLEAKSDEYHLNQLIPDIDIPMGEETERLPNIGINQWHELFNPRQLLTLVSYVEIINEAKAKILAEYELEKAQAIITYLALVLDRCVDRNCRLSIWNSGRFSVERASTQHSLNLNWNYPEVSGIGELWNQCADAFTSEFSKLCEYINQEKNVVNKQEKTSKKQQQLTLTVETPPETKLTKEINPSNININLESADSLYHIPDKTLEAIVTDPPYYGTIQYAELSDFFYVWNKRILGDIFPDIFWQELTDKDREAVANPSRFRNMGISPDELAKQDYEGKMNMAWNEAYRVLKDEGVLTVQFNHKESGAWDVLAKSLIDAGFEITASWAVSTENPQNLHQAKKNSVSSTVILVCRKRDSNAPQAWWDDLRPEVANLVESRAEYFEDNDITGIDLYLSAFGVALNVFSKSYPILDNTGKEVRPEVAFAEARKAIAGYRFRKLLQTDTIGFDALTQWYLLAWDAFGAREFPFDEARQLALAVGGFNVNDLAKEYKLIDSASGICKLLTPQQRLKKRAFTINPQEFSMDYLIDGLHALIGIYEDEADLEAVRKFLKNTGLGGNDLLVKVMEVAFKVIPDSMKEKQTLINLWLGIDEIKSKVQFFQTEMFEG
ncbi:DUF1156 domain-containing protein [Cyanobacterium stanieri LEGE 03274]|uniref:DUF1156 domain-containing protein n=1 Tax=Cyanobacterium stanieri LEGE 03274 TaxID=1828756 RepID=A0ABR9V0H3_9CHRO|nr:DUF1156 domain-containing protein [Cyanobacterium stanieri]MBE9221375.1 DUF1156 domain-containing protein [Cyanobacterium stanieri LEGE 03274]